MVGTVDRGQTRAGTRVHQIPGHFGLAVNHDTFPAGQLRKVNAVALAANHQLKAGVAQAFLVHALPHACFVEQIGGHLLQHASPDTRQHIVRGLALDNDGVDTRLVQQLPEQQTRRPCTYDDNLGTHDKLLFRMLSSLRRLGDAHGSKQDVLCDDRHPCANVAQTFDWTEL